MTCLNKRITEQRQYIILTYWIIVYGISFAGQNVALFFAHVKVLESLDEVSLETDQLIRLALIDGIPSYVPIVVVLVLILVLMGMSCTKSKDEIGGIRRQKMYIIGISLFTIVFGCICTISQVAVVLFKDILIFLNKKAGGVAECYCLLDSVSGSVWTSAFSTVPSSVLDLHWCRCNVPGEEYPVGFSAADPNMTIDTSFLKNFLEKDEYEGDFVAKTIVETKEELLRLTDNEFQHLKMLLAMAELSVFFVVLRMPIFFVMGKAMARDLASDKSAAEKKKLEEELRQISPHENENGTNSLTIEHQKKVLEARSSVLAETISKAILYKDMKSHVLANLEVFIEIVVYAFIESLDAYSLLDDIVEHRYIFGGDQILTIITLVLILINSIVVNGSSIVVFFSNNSTTKIPMGEYLKFVGIGTSHVKKEHVLARRSRYIKTASKVTKLLVVIFSNLPFAALRCYLMWTYDGFHGAQVGSIYVIFIMKEIVLFVMGIIEFVVSNRKNEETPVKPVNTHNNEAFSITEEMIKTTKF